MRQDKMTPASKGTQSALSGPKEDIMIVLIVEPEPELGRLWKRHLERQGAQVHLVRGQDGAFDLLRAHAVDMIVLDLVLQEGSALAISDYASYRRPSAQVIFVTNTTFFSDGSIFLHSPNACAFLQSATPPEDIAAMVAHYCKAG
jgi:DNA-binding NtrC family response regulator